MLLFGVRKQILKVTDPKARLHALPSSPPSSIYLRCSGGAAQNLTQYILPGK